MIEKFSISGREKSRKNSEVQRKSTKKAIQQKQSIKKDTNLNQDILNSLLRIGNIKKKLTDRYY